MNEVTVALFPVPGISIPVEFRQEPGVNTVEAAVGHDHHLVAFLKAGGDLLDNLAGRGEAVCVLALLSQVSHQPIQVEPEFGVQLLGSEDRAQYYVVGIGETTGKLPLKYPSAGSCGPGFEYRPHAVTGKLLPDGGQGGGNGSGMVGEIVKDGDSGCFTADLQASLHALEGA